MAEFQYSIWSPYEGWVAPPRSIEETESWMRVIRDTDSPGSRFHGAYIREYREETQ